jgi:hypothetical protein
MERAKLVHLAKQALPIAGVLFAILLAGMGIQKGVSWIIRNRENRQWLAVNNLTPERLLARCGQPAEDNTHLVFPVVTREIRYTSSGGRNVVLAFSRTAEEGSAWVFLSIKDGRSGLPFDTPSAKIDALPCLDSRK